jgi:hypothetical protein
LDGKENRLLLKRAGNAIYGSGFLLYLRDTTLIAQAFDPEQGQLKGDAHTDCGAGRCGRTCCWVL